MSIVELPADAVIPDGVEDEASEASVAEPMSPTVARRRKSKEQKAKRKMNETPTLLDPDLAHKKRSEDSDQVVKQRRRSASKGRASPKTTSEDGSRPQSRSEKVKTPSDRKATKSPAPGKVKIRRKKDSESKDEHQPISPDLQRKPPPKPKTADQEVEAVVSKRRNSRKVTEEEVPHPMERPNTPRQARAPSPEERPLVVPLPPPRMQDAFMKEPPPVPARPQHAPEPEEAPPPVPERTMSAQKPTIITFPPLDALPCPEPSNEEVPSLAPASPFELATASVIVQEEEALKKPEVTACDISVADPPVERQREEILPSDSGISSEENLQQRGLFQSDSTSSKSVINQDDSEPKGEDIKKEDSLPKVVKPKPVFMDSTRAAVESAKVKLNRKDISFEKTRKIESVSKAIAAKLDSEKKQSPPSTIGPMSPSAAVAAAQQQLAAVKTNIQSLVTTTASSAASNVQQQSDEAKLDGSQEKGPAVEKEQSAAAAVEQQPVAVEAKKEPPTLAPFSISQLAENGTANGSQSSISSGGNRNGDDTRSLINSIPKPFKVEIDSNKSLSSSPLQTPAIQPEPPKNNNIRKVNTSDSVGSAISLSSSGSNHSIHEKATKPASPQTAPIPVKLPGRPFTDLSTASPNNSGAGIHQQAQQAPKPGEKRDSKVIKAAQYWNNFIGEVMVKNKPPENPKNLEKPRKITSAGVGQKGYNDLKTAFEKKHQQTHANEANNGNEKSGGFQRRNSKKMVVEGCQPGLRVTDAKNVFEMKNQPSTPVIYRRNSVTPSNEKDQKPKWSQRKMSDEKSDGVKSPDLNKMASEPFKEPSPPSNSVSNGPVNGNQPKDKTEKTETTLQAPKQKPATSPKPKLKSEDIQNRASSQKTPEKPKAEPKAPVQKPKPVVVEKPKPTVAEAPNPVVVEKPKPVVEKPKPAAVETAKPRVAADQAHVAEKTKPAAVVEVKKAAAADLITREVIKAAETKAEDVETEKRVSPIPPKLPTTQTPTLPVKEAAAPPSSDAAKVRLNNPTLAEPSAVANSESQDDQVVSAQENPLEAVKNSLKKVPHAPGERRKSIEEPSVDTSIPTSTRIIPIQIESRDTDKKAVTDNAASKLNETPTTTSSEIRSKEEHYIPIHVEGVGPILNTQISKEEQEAEANERFDSFHTNSLSRRRFGSRKKRMSSAYSDSSMSDEDGSFGTSFGGLQRYSSLGKHGLSQEQPSALLKLRKTRPPFAMQRSDSFSSGEDDFDDDGFREMTAENLFSTLLSRVKSLTRRIHDEHEEQFHNRLAHTQRIVNHPLNPGGTHARLERSAQRNSLKRNQPPTLSRQSSTDAASRYDDGTSSVRSYGSVRSNDTYNSQQQQTRGTSSNVKTVASFHSDSKRHSDVPDNVSDDSNVSVTSRQRLRPGYLPPPPNLTMPPASIRPTTVQPPPLPQQPPPPPLLPSVDHVRKSDSVSSVVSNPTLENLTSPLNVYMKVAKPFSRADEDDKQLRRSSRISLPENWESEAQQQDKPKFSRMDSSSSIASAASSDTKVLQKPLSTEGQFVNRAMMQQRQDSISSPPPPPIHSPVPPKVIPTTPINVPHKITFRNSISTINSPISSPPNSLYLPQGVISPTFKKRPPSFTSPTSTHPSSPSPLSPANSELLEPKEDRVRRTILPYGGAKSDGLMVNKHAFISCNVIAAADRRRKDASRANTQDLLLLEKVMTTMKTRLGPSIKKSPFLFSRYFDVDFSLFEN